ncbi:hypothetical protein GQ457_02G030310 [Hibiscus cannabinus]
MFTAWPKIDGFRVPEADREAWIACFQRNALRANAREGCSKLLLFAFNTRVVIALASNTKLLVILRRPSFKNRLFKAALSGIDSIGGKSRDDAPNSPGFGISPLEPRLKAAQLLRKAYTVVPSKILWKKHKASAIPPQSKMLT